MKRFRLLHNIRVTSLINQLLTTISEINLAGIQHVAEVSIIQDPPFFTLYAKGTNILSILKSYDFAYSATRCDNVLETQDCFGIEAARSTVIQELLSVLMYYN